MLFYRRFLRNIFQIFSPVWRGVIREILLCSATASLLLQDWGLSQKYNARICPSKVSNSATLNFLNVRWSLATLLIPASQPELQIWITQHNRQHVTNTLNWKLKLISDSIWILSLTFFSLYNLKLVFSVPNIYDMTLLKSVPRGS